MAEIKIIPARDRSEDIIRTAAYARVSSDSEDQLNSYNAQIRYYTEMLRNRVLVYILANALGLKIVLKLYITTMERDICVIFAVMRLYDFMIMP